MTSRVIRLAAAVCAITALSAFAGNFQAQAEELGQFSGEKELSPADKHYRIGMRKMMHGNEKKAINHFKKVIELDPESYNTRLMLGKLYGGRGNLKMSAETFRAAIEVRPGDYRAYDLLISLLLYVDRPVEAVVAGEKAIRNGVDDKMLLDLGWAYYQAGMMDKAEARYMRELEVNNEEDLFAPHRNLGILYIARKDYEKALVHLAAAEEIGDEPKEVPFLAAMAYAQLDRKSEAHMSIGVFKDRVKNYAKRADKYMKSYFPHTTPPDMREYIFTLKPDFVEETSEPGR